MVASFPEENLLSNLKTAHNLEKSMLSLLQKEYSDSFDGNPYHSLNHLYSTALQLSSQEEIIEILDRIANSDD